MAFSATDAAFEGFRLVRRNPMALVAWTLLYLVYTLATLFAAGGMMRSMSVWMEQVEALEAGTATPWIITAAGDILAPNWIDANGRRLLGDAIVEDELPIAA